MAQQDKTPTEAFLLLRKQLIARVREEFAKQNGLSSAPASQSAVPDPLEQRVKARKEALELEEERFREARRSMRQRKPPSWMWQNAIT